MVYLAAIHTFPGVETLDSLTFMDPIARSTPRPVIDSCLIVF